MWSWFPSTKWVNLLTPMSPTPHWPPSCPQGKWKHLVLWRWLITKSQQPLRTADLPPWNPGRPWGPLNRDSLGKMGRRANWLEEGGLEKGRRKCQQYPEAKHSSSTIYLPDAGSLSSLPASHCPTPDHWTGFIDRGSSRGGGRPAWGG